MDRYRCRTGSIIVTLAAVLYLLPSVAHAECKEFKLEEFEDRIEAVCVGEPLTAAQKQALAEEERRQEQATKRQKAEDERRQKEMESAEAKRNTQAERKGQATRPVPPAPKVDSNKTNLQKL